MFKRMMIVIIILLIIFGAIFGLKYQQITEGMAAFANYSPPPVTVSANKAKTQNWQPYLNSIGTLTAVNGVEVSTEVGGTIKEILFKSGEEVSQGQILIKIDDQVEQADLKRFEAQLKLAKINYERDRTLLAKRAIPQTTFDRSKATLEEAVASVESTKAVIAKKTIRAPFNGKIGIRMVDLGEYVSPGTPIATLQDTNPLYVDFNLPEQDFPKLAIDQTVEFTVEAHNKDVFRGKLIAINSKVNEETRNLLVRASVSNEQDKLLPGMFANLRVLLPTTKPVITVPLTAITYSLYGDSVFLIKEEGKAEDGNPLLTVTRHYVKTGEERNGEVAVLSGLEAGAQVVTSGQLKLNNGTRIIINNDVEL